MVKIELGTSLERFTLARGSTNQSGNREKGDARRVRYKKQGSPEKKKLNHQSGLNEEESNSLNHIFDY